METSDGMQAEGGGRKTVEGARGGGGWDAGV